jgi:hypothetical protein
MLLRERGKKMNRLSSANKKSFIRVSLPDEGPIAGPDSVLCGTLPDLSTDTMKLKTVNYRYFFYSCQAFYK